MGLFKGATEKSKTLVIAGLTLICSTVFAVVGIVMFVMTKSSAANTYPINPEYTITNFLVGNGDSEETAYEISSLSELEKLRTNVNHGSGLNYAGKYFKLTTNIDMGGAEWVPIGGYNNTTTSYFAGNFDGNGKTISNFKVENIVDLFRVVENEGTGDQYEYQLTEYRARDYGGLFGYTNGANIKNLSVENVNFGTLAKNNEGAVLRGNLGSYHGAVVGYATGGTTFENVSVSNVSIANFAAYAGGAVGYSNTNSKYTSIFVDNVTIANAASANAYIGGMVGYINTANTLNLININDININAAQSYVGGMAGAINTTTSIYGGSISNVKLKGASYVAGVYGRSEATTTINSPVGTDDPFEITGLSITASAAYAGGIGGYAVGATNRAANVKVRDAFIESTVASAAYVGGLYGRFSGNNSTIEGCEFNGEIYAAHDSIGGILGYSDNDVYIYDTKVISQSISGRHNVGGFVGSGVGSTSGGTEGGTTGLVLVNCRMEGYVVARMGSAGGLIGQGYGFAVRECMVQGSVQALSGANTTTIYAAGGIVGHETAAATYAIVNNFVKATVLGVNVTATNSHTYVGGVIGYDSGAAAKLIKRNMIRGEVLAFSSGGSASATNIAAGGIVGMNNYATASSTIEQNAILAERIWAQRGTNTGKTGVRSQLIGSGTAAANVPRTVNTNYFAYWLQSNNANNAMNNNWRLENWFMGTTYVPTAAPVPTELTLALMYDLTTYTGATLNWSPSTWAISPSVNDGLPYLRSVGAPSTQFLGSEGNPYLIRGASDLQEMYNRLNQGDTLAGRHYRVAYNIDLQGATILPIGTASYDRAFAGVFDGNSRTISNFKFPEGYGNYQGVFGNTLFSVVKNITFDGITVGNGTAEAASSVGAVAGAAHYSEFNNVNVRNANINITSNNVGGIVGYGTSLYFDNCSVKSSRITTNGSLAGGLVGDTGYHRGFIRGCVVEADVTANAYAGGLVGRVISLATDTGTDTSAANNPTYMTYADTIRRSSFTGNVLSKGTYAGGLVGHAQAARIYESYTNGTVTAKGVYSGGLIGYTNQTPYIIQDCAIYANVYSLSGTANVSAGGVIGQTAIAGTANSTDSTIIRTIVHGEVLAINAHVSSTSYTAYAGGLIGHSTVATNSVGGCVVASPRIAAYAGLGSTYRAHQIGTGSAAANAPEFRTAAPILNYCLDTLAADLVDNGGNKGTTYVRSFNANQCVNKTQSDLSTQGQTPYETLGWQFGASNPWSRMSSQNDGIPYLSSRGVAANLKVESAANRITINSPEDFIAFNERVRAGDPLMGRFVRLDTNLDLAFIPWTPSTSAASQIFFGGSFNGNNKILSNISMSTDNVNPYQSLFGQMIAGSVSNLTIENFGLKSTGDYCGVISGSSSYTRYSNININNSSIQNTGTAARIGGVVGWSFVDTFDNIKVNNVLLQGSQYVGGIAGVAEKSSAKNCSVGGKIVSRGAYTGGIFGSVENNNATSVTRHGIMIDGCSTSGTMSGTSHVGGIAGQVAALNGHLITRSVNKMEITASGNFVGGVVGLAQGSSINHLNITKTGNTGNVLSTSGGARVGGLVGNARGVNINESYNTGTVRNIHASSAKTYVGGLIGAVTTAVCNIDNSFNSGEIIAFSSSITATNSIYAAGGLVGTWYDNDPSTTTAAAPAANVDGGIISNSYNAGDVYAVSYINSTNQMMCLASGIVGYALAKTSVQINNCFNIADTISAYTPGGTASGSAMSDAFAITTGSAAAATTNLPTAGATAAYLGNNVRVNPWWRSNATAGNLGTPWPTPFASAATSQSSAWFTRLPNLSGSLKWDTTNTWDRDALVNSGMPFLKNAPHPTYNLGTKQNPFRIGTEAELQALRNEVNAGDRKQGLHYRLTNNIHITETNWIPIGSAISPFMGNFDGDEYVISNLKTTADQDYWGLFGYVINAKITNVIVNDISVNMTLTGGNFVGGIVGYSLWGLTMDSCAVLRGNITVTGGDKGLYVGGLVGYVDCNLATWIFNSVKRSYSTCNVTGRAQVGGVVGAAAGAEVSQCMASGSITASNTYNTTVAYAGGIIGASSGTSSQVTDCAFYGTVLSNVTSAAQAVAGGVIGHINIANVSTLPGGSTIPRTRILRCLITGNVSAVNALSSTTVSQGSWVGGAVGYATVAAEISYSAVVSKRITATAAAAPVEVASYFGNWSTAALTTTITLVCQQNLYSETVLLSAYKVGTTAYQTFNNNASGSYMLAEEMRIMETYLTQVSLGGPGWDFAVTWEVNPMRNDGYPTLKSLPLDPTRLLGAIQRAEDIYLNPLPRLYSNVTWSRLQSAVNAARTLLGVEANDYMINAAIDVIEDAIKELRAEKSELQDLEFDIRINIEPYGPSGTDSYIAFASMADALKYARLILADNTNKYTNIDVNNAVAMLKNARSGLVVKKTQLNQLIDQIERLPTVGYIAAGEWGYDNLISDRLLRAKIISANANATAPMVGNMTAELQTALDALVIDYSALTAILVEARLFSGIDLPDFNPEVYKYASWQSFITKYNAALEIDKNRNVSVTQVATATQELRTTLYALIPDDTALRQIFESVKNETSTYYSLDSWSVFLTRLNETSVVLGLSAPVPSDLQNRIWSIAVNKSNLETAYHNLTFDVSSLVAYLIIAEAEYNTMPTGVNKTNLGVAIYNANEVITDVTAAQLGGAKVPNNQKAAMKSRIAAAFTGLDSNINSLEAARLALLNKINEVENLYPASNKAAYTSDTWEIFALALDLAKYRYDTSSDPAVLKSQVITLDAAAKGLKLDKTGLYTLISELELLEAEHFSAESFDRLITALAAARGIYENEYATNDSVLNAIVALNTAKMGLEPEKGELRALVDQYPNPRNDKTISGVYNTVGDASSGLKIHAVYTVSSWDMFMIRLSDARTVLNTTVTHNQVQTALINLRAAIDNLTIDFKDLDERIAESQKNINSPYYTEDVNKSQLRVSLGIIRDIRSEEDLNLGDVQGCLDVLYQRNKALVVTVEPLANSVAEFRYLVEVHYSYASWSRFAIMFNSAEAFLAQFSSTVSHDEVKTQHERLLSAYEQLEIDKTNLRVLITQAEAVKKNSITTESWDALQILIKDAKAVDAKLNAVEEEVDAVFKALQYILPRLTPSLTKLDALIAEAQLLMAKTFTQATKDELQIRIDSAMTERNKPLVNSSTVTLGTSVATVESIEFVYTYLNLAKTNLIVDTTALTTAINQADIIIGTTYLLSGTVKPSSEFYTQTTWIAFMAARSVALMYTGELKNVELVNTATAALLEAISGLEINRSALVAKITSINSLREENYTELSWANLMSAVDAANLVRVMDEHAVNPAQRLTIQKMLDAINGIDTAVNQLELDTAMLDDLLAEIDELNEGDYTEASWALLQTRVQEAYAAILEFEEHGTSVDMDLIFRNLVNAFNDLVNIAELLERVEEMQNVINANKDKVPFDYTITSWNSFVRVVESAAEATIRTKDDINAMIGAMQAAYDALVKVNVLNQTIKTSEELYADKAHLYKETDFTFYFAEMLYAKGVIGNASATQSQVNGAINRIELAEARLNASAIDYEKLLYELYETVKLKAAADFTVGSYTTFETIALRVAVLLQDYDAGRTDFGAYTQEELQAFYQEFINLETADSNLVTIKALKKLRDDSDGSFDVIDYTALSYSVFTNAFAQAETVLANSTATQKQVDDATTALQAAIDGLIEVSARGYLLEMYNDNEKLLAKENDYSVSSFAGFKQKMQAALALVENIAIPNNDSRFTTALDELDTAISALVYVKGLKDAITTAELAIDDLYTTESKAALITAIANAKTKLTDTVNPIESRDVDSLISAIQSAVTGLTVDADRIDALLEQVKDYSDSQFTAGFADFFVARHALQNAMKAESTSTALEKIAAYENLVGEISKLRVNTSTAVTLIAKFNGLNSGHYSSGYTAARNAITILESSIANSLISLESYLALMQNAQTAMGNMVQNSKQELANLVAYYEANQAKYENDSFVVFRFNYLNPAKALLPDTNPMTVAEIQSAVNTLKNGAKNVLVELKVNNMFIIDSDNINKPNASKLKMVDKNGEEITRDESYVYNSSEKAYITNIAAGTSISELASQFVSDSGTIRYFNADGTEITNLNGKVATGMTMKLYYGAVLADVITFVVMGDINGTGTVDMEDIGVLFDAVFGQTELTEVQILAGQISSSGEVSVVDLNLIYGYLKGINSDMFEQMFGYSA